MGGERQMQSVLWPILVFLGVALLLVYFVPATMAADAQSKKANSADDDLQKLAEELDEADEKEKPTTETAEESMERATIATTDLESRRKNQAKEQRDRLTKDPKWRPTHDQIHRFKVESKLNNFCLDSKGQVLACCNDSKIRVFSQEGKLVDTWKLDFAPQAIGVCKAKGTIVVGGEGQLAKLSPAGSVLQKQVFPRPMSDEEIEAAVQSQVESQKKMFEDYLRGLKSQLAETEKNLAKEQKDEEKPKDEGTGRLSSPLSVVSGMRSGEDGFQLVFKDGTPLAMQAKAVKEYRRMMDQQYGGEEKLAEKIRSRMKTASRTATFTGIAVAEKDLFIVCSGPGYSFNAWRTSHDLQDAKLIVQGLRGCCGQMDCQTHGGDLWIPMNTQHKVYRYDRDGTELSKFGKRDREAADGFGGCCEPKNLRFGEDGSAYCSESGPPVCVKRFSLDGKFQNVVCFPVYGTGCVRVSVDLCDEKVFLLSPNENAIYVFAPKQQG